MRLYSATDIADYMIKKCNDEKCPITNLQVQKILYFLQKEYLQNENKPLFSDNIQAWQFGPVVPEVYYKYCALGAMPITRRYNNEVAIDFDDLEKINPIIIEKRAKYPWDLVKETHKSGGAWETVYNQGKGNQNVIPIELIRTKG